MLAVLRTDRVSERWGPWSAPSEATTPSILLESLPSRPELKPLKGLAIEAEWSPPVVGKKAKVAGYEVQWAQVASQLEWSTERQARTANLFVLASVASEADEVIVLSD